MKIADNYLDNLTFVMYDTLAHLGSSEGFSSRYNVSCSLIVVKSWKYHELLFRRVNYANSIILLIINREINTIILENWPKHFEENRK